MKVIIAALTAVAVLAGVPAAADAASSGEGYQTYEVKHRYVKKKYKRRHHRQPQYWADKMPFGTQAWWDQMDREGRGGRRR